MKVIVFQGAHINIYNKHNLFGYMGYCVNPMYFYDSYVLDLFV